MNQYEKIPPQALEIESYVLGSLLLETSKHDFINQMQNVFYKQSNVIIFDVIKKMRKERKQIDILTVTNQIKQSGKLKDVGGIKYLTELTSNIGSSMHFESHYTILVEKFIARNIIMKSSEISEKAYDNEIDDCDKEITALSTFISVSITGEVVGRHVSDIAHDALVEAEKRMINRQKGIDNGIHSGIHSLHEITGGWQNGDLIILAGRPSMGKTAVAIQFAKHPAKRGTKVAFFSLEMGGIPIIDRAILGETTINPTNWRNGDINGEDLEQYEAFEHDSKKWNLNVYDKVKFSTSHIRTICKKENPDLIIIDFLQLMKHMVEKKNSSKNDDVGATCQSLKSIALEFNIPIILLCQLNRSVEGRATKIPGLSDLRDCLSIDTSFIYNNKYVQTNCNSQMNLLSLSNNKIIEAMSNNIEKTENVVFRLKTASGRFIDCTKKHKILTTSGYKMLQYITDEDSIAIALDWNNDESKYIQESRFIGWMLGNGCMYGYNVPSFITSDKIISDDFIEYVNDKFGFYPKEHKHYKSKVYQWDITKNSVRTREGNPVTSWLKENDSWGRKAKDKYIPEWFMENADRQSIKELIQGLWETDGSVALGKKTSFQYSTTSITLANQIIYLLAKLGILASLDNGHKSKLATTKCFKIHINSGDQLKKFIENISLRGEKGVKLTMAKISDRQTYHSNRMNIDTTIEIKEKLDHLKRKEVRIQTHGGRRLTKRRLSELVDKYPEILDCYKWVLSDHIFWDNIVSIEKLGIRKVFDRNVPVTSNFVVNGIIVHNSGEIEQIADLVIFPYRSFYYSGEESEKNKIDFVIAKHRNGITGTVQAEHNEYMNKFFDTNKLF